MHEPFSSTPFELAGRFGGFVFTTLGKRRLLLRREGEPDCLLKVPRLLRRRIIGKFRLGDPIRVAGMTERGLFTSAPRQVVSRVLPDAAIDGTLPAAPVPAAVSCPVKVCSKKNCWRNGGRELWDALRSEVRARGLEHSVELQQVGCLDRCQRAPNADWNHHEFTGCQTADARAIIARATAGAAV